MRLIYTFLFLIFCLFSSCDIYQKVKGDRKIPVDVCVAKDVCISFEFSKKEKNKVADISDFVAEKVAQTVEIELSGKSLTLGVQSLNSDTVKLVDYTPKELSNLIQNQPAAPNPIAKSFHPLIENGKPITYGIFQKHPSESFTLSKQKELIKKLWR